MAQEIKKTEPTSSPAPRYTDPFSAMRSEMDRVFDSFLGRSVMPSFSRMPFLARNGERGAMMPDIDVRETPQSIILEAELPGLDDKDVSVTLKNGVLTLKGEKKSEHEETKDDYHLMERSFGSFQRSFEVADAIEDDKIQATFDKGVLKVVMPKRADNSKAEKKISIGKG